MFFLFLCTAILSTTSFPLPVRNLVLEVTVFWNENAEQLRTALLSKKEDGMDGAWTSTVSYSENKMDTYSPPSKDGMGTTWTGTTEDGTIRQRPGHLCQRMGSKRTQTGNICNFQKIEKLNVYSQNLY